MGELLGKRGEADSIKGLAEVRGNNNDVGVIIKEEGSEGVND